MIQIQTDLVMQHHFALFLIEEFSGFYRIKELKFFANYKIETVKKYKKNRYSAFFSFKNIKKFFYIYVFNATKQQKLKQRISSEF